MKHILLILIMLLAPIFNVIANDDLELGPGVFTGKKGSFTLFETTKEKTVDEKAKKNVLSQQDEFALFKAWKQHKESHSLSYQEFLLWIEYKKVMKPSL